MGKTVVLRGQSAKISFPKRYKAHWSRPFDHTSKNKLDQLFEYLGCAQDASRTHRFLFSSGRSSTVVWGIRGGKGASVSAFASLSHFHQHYRKVLSLIVAFGTIISTTRTLFRPLQVFADRCRHSSRSFATAREFLVGLSPTFCYTIRFL